MAEREGVPSIQRAIVVAMYPDVCVKDGAKVPYDIYALASDDVSHSTDVRYTEAWALNEASRLQTCYGNAAASGGVRSGSVQGWCWPAEELTSTVNVNGRRAVTHDTIFEMNASAPGAQPNTRGRMVHITEGGQDRYVLASTREQTLEQLKQRFDRPDFYEALAKYDPANADKWMEMVAVQERFAIGELGYSAAETVTYSASMRQTLHGAVINLFEDPAGLARVEAASPTGLYDWYIRMHGTAFRFNGAWNTDFIDNGVGVMTNTDPAMIAESPTLAEGMWDAKMGNEDPYAAKAVEQVRAMRAARGLKVTRRPGEPKPEGAGGKPIIEPSLSWDPPQVGGSRGR